MIKPNICKGGRKILSVLRCRDGGMDCDFAVKAGIEEEILKKPSEYANRVQKMEEIQEEVLVIIIFYHERNRNGNECGSVLRRR